MKVLVTGGCGFIGSAVVRRLIEHSDHEVLNLDRMTYASTTGSVAAIADSDRYRFVHGDIGDRELVDEVMVGVDLVLHLAAESHVDRSIDGPAAFIDTNVLGTYTLLEAARAAEVGRFVHVSTDEVYGSLGLDDPPRTEAMPYAPRSPYAASKAAADHLARAWAATYGLDVVVTNSSNNYGPFQFPEKLIPLMVLRALRSEPLPVYGDGGNVRDWLHVEDHARALVEIGERGVAGATYNVGGGNERTNLEIVHAIADLIDATAGQANDRPRRELVSFVEDRPGHDLRYAIDDRHLRTALGWAPTIDFEDGLARTVQWYLDREDWWRPLLDRGATRRRGLG